MTWKETRERLSRDRARLAEVLAGGARRCHAAFYPAYLCVCMHRVAHLLERRGWSGAARLVSWSNWLLTGAWIGPGSDLGPGLVIPSPVAVTIEGDAGRDLTVMDMAAVETDRNRTGDAGAGSGRPRLGDRVWLSPKACVSGPVRVGCAVRVPPGMLVTEDLPDAACPPPMRTRFTRRGR